MKMANNKQYGMRAGVDLLMTIPAVGAIRTRLAK
jgi:hypothetical protein